MFPSWMSPRNSVKHPIAANHAVLGTPLQALLIDDQEEAVFACGCFWGAEKGFWRLPGVVTTAVGYAGGDVDNPSYNQVCSGRTGHTEVVRVVWDSSIIDFSDLLKLFWECHDPTQGNRQGNDTGSQYRSAIYTSSERQFLLANASRDAYQNELELQGFGLITTEIRMSQLFFLAEDYHQQYLAKPNSRPYCSAMPTRVLLEDFPGADYKMPKKVWRHYDWNVKHCVLRGDNSPIRLN
ncbi:peptide-methionine (S)-S-oxide reductase MsrA [Synechococcus sp. M16CYN]|uniref:peptide-methionine (S)-S-oxide reductase MsrA n=1 Tax=Synechococcus sp. M16CYN TaxID=3103139 RepID=UPI00324CC459